MSVQKVGLENVATVAAAGLLGLLVSAGTAWADLRICTALEIPFALKGHVQCKVPEAGDPKTPGVPPAGGQCTISAASETWIKNNTDVQLASTNLNNIITGLGAIGTTSWPTEGAYTRPKFGTTELAATANRDEARLKFGKAKEDLGTLVSKIAGSADEVCYKCYLLNDWYIFRTAAQFIRDTSIMDKAFQLGVAKLASMPAERTVVLEADDGTVTTSSKQLLLDDVTVEMVATLKTVDTATSLLAPLCDGLYAMAKGDNAIRFSKAQSLQSTFNILLKTSTLWGQTTGTSAMSKINGEMATKCPDTTAFFHKEGSWQEMCKLAGIKK